MEENLICMYIYLKHYYRSKVPSRKQLGAGRRGWTRWVCEMYSFGTLRLCGATNPAVDYADSSSQVKDIDVRQDAFVSRHNKRCRSGSRPLGVLRMIDRELSDTGFRLGTLPR
jgi:ribosomal protein S14